jgi:hypothetical protein
METGALARYGENQPLPSVLDLMPFGVILLDKFNHYVQSNQLAARIIAEADGLRIVNNSLYATNLDSRQYMRRAFEKIRTANDNPCADSGAEIIPVCRASGRASLEILITPLHQPPHTAFVQGSPSIAVLIWDTEKAPLLRRERIRHMYRLTDQGKFVLPVSGPGGATGIFCHAQIIEDEAHAER